MDFWKTLTQCDGNRTARKGMKTLTQCDGNRTARKGMKTLTQCDGNRTARKGMKTLTQNPIFWICTRFSVPRLTETKPKYRNEIEIPERNIK